MKKPLLSISVPTYNRARYLEECLNSIVCQFSDKNTCERVQIIVSDNASEDGTRELVKGYERKFENIRYLRNETTIPSSENWNKAFCCSTGEFLNLIGDDDLYLPDSLDKMLLFLSAIRTDVISTAGYQMVNSIRPPGFSYTSSVFHLSRKELAEAYFSFGAKTIPIKNLNLTPTFLFFRAKLVHSIEANYGTFWKEPIGDHFGLFSALSLSGSLDFWDCPITAYRAHPQGHLATKYDCESMKERLDHFLNTTQAKFDVLPGPSFTNLIYVAMQDIQDNFPVYRDHKINLDQGLYVHCHDVFLSDLRPREKLKYINQSFLKANRKFPLFSKLLKQVFRRASSSISKKGPMHRARRKLASKTS
jgi:glycosyltransferase involved in cell wall biosynthesis